MDGKVRKLIFLKATSSCILTSMDMVSKLYQDLELRPSWLHVNRIHPVCGGLMVEAADNTTRDVFHGLQAIKNAGLNASALNPGAKN